MFGFGSEFFDYTLTNFLKKLKNKSVSESLLTHSFVVVRMSRDSNEKRAMGSRTISATRSGEISQAGARRRSCWKP